MINNSNALINVKNLVVLVLLAASSIASASVDVQKEGGPFKFAGKGKLFVFDSRSTPSSNDYSDGLNAVKRHFHPTVQVVTGKRFSVEAAASFVKEYNAQAVVFIVDDDKLPMTLLASEERWACVNEAKLISSSVTRDVLCRRLSILFSRQCYRLLGSDATRSPDTCLYPIFTIRDIDDIKGFEISAWAQMSINDSMRRIGFEPEEYGTYQDACEAGLAPTPTNDVQKAIWDKVHAPPKNPMKIEFDPKKGR